MDEIISGILKEGKLHHISVRIGDELWEVGAFSPGVYNFIPECPEDARILVGTLTDSRTGQQHSAENNPSLPRVETGIPFNLSCEQPVIYLARYYPESK